MGVLELHNAKKYRLDSAVAPQTPIPLYPIRQQRGFWIPRMGVLELHYAKKYYLGSGVAPIPLYPIRQQRWGCLGEILFAFWGGAPNTHTSVPYCPIEYL